MQGCRVVNASTYSCVERKARQCGPAHRVGRCYACVGTSDEREANALAPHATVEIRNRTASSLSRRAPSCVPPLNPDYCCSRNTPRTPPIGGARRGYRELGLAASSRLSRDTASSMMWFSAFDAVDCPPARGARVLRRTFITGVIAGGAPAPSAPTRYSEHHIDLRIHPGAHRSALRWLRRANLCSRKSTDAGSPAARRH